MGENFKALHLITYETHYTKLEASSPASARQTPWALLVVRVLAQHPSLCLGGLFASVAASAPNAVLFQRSLREHWVEVSRTAFKAAGLTEVSRIATG